jgi:hypothetical protein
MAATKKYCTAFLTEKEALVRICTQQFVYTVLKKARFFLTFGWKTGRHD